MNAEIFMLDNEEKFDLPPSATNGFYRMSHLRRIRNDNSKIATSTSLNIQAAGETEILPLTEECLQDYAYKDSYAGQQYDAVTLSKARVFNSRYEKHFRNAEAKHPSKNNFSSPTQSASSVITQNLPSNNQTDNIQITIMICDRYNNNNGIMLKVYPQNSIKDLKDLLQQCPEYPPSSFQRLFYKNTELKNTRTLNDCDISDGSKLILTKNRVFSLNKASVSLFGEYIPNNECTHMLQSVSSGLVCGYAPTISLEGTGGTYFLKDGNGYRCAVFKPQDEEPYTPNNPRGFTGDFGSPGIKPGVESGGGAAREAAAYYLDSKYSNFCRVPHTIIVEICHPNAFHTSYVDKLSQQNNHFMTVNNETLLPYNNSSIPGRKSNLNTKNLSNAATKSTLSTSFISKIGSLQEYVRFDGTAGDYGPSKYSVSDVHRIGILDIRIINTDRNEGNLLVRCSTSEDGKQAMNLIPIDHGYCLPLFLAIEQCDQVWMDWPQSKEPFDKETLEYIESIDIASDVQMLCDNLSLSDDCINVFILVNKFLKKAAAAGLTLSNIAHCISRREQEKPSDIEALSAQATILSTVMSRRQSRYRRRRHTHQGHSSSPVQNRSNMSGCIRNRSLTSSSNQGTNEFETKFCDDSKSYSLPNNSLNESNPINRSLFNITDDYLDNLNNVKHCRNCDNNRSNYSLPSSNCLNTNNKNSLDCISKNYLKTNIFDNKVPISRSLSPVYRLSPIDSDLFEDSKSFVQNSPISDESIVCENCLQQQQEWGNGVDDLQSFSPSLKNTPSPKNFTSKFYQSSTDSSILDLDDSQAAQPFQSSYINFYEQSMVNNGGSSYRVPSYFRFANDARRVFNRSYAQALCSDKKSNTNYDNYNNLRRDSNRSLCSSSYAADTQPLPSLIQHKNVSPLHTLNEKQDFENISPTQDSDKIEHISKSNQVNLSVSPINKKVYSRHNSFDDTELYTRRCISVLNLSDFFYETKEGYSMPLRKLAFTNSRTNQNFADSSQINSPSLNYTSSPSMFRNRNLHSLAVSDEQIRKNLERYNRYINKRSSNSFYEDENSLNSLGTILNNKKKNCADSNPNSPLQSLYFKYVDELLVYFVRFLVALNSKQDSAKEKQKQNVQAVSKKASDTTITRTKKTDNTEHKKSPTTSPDNKLPVEYTETNSTDTDFSSDDQDYDDDSNNILFLPQ